MANRIKFLCCILVLICVLGCGDNNKETESSVNTTTSTNPDVIETTTTTNHEKPSHQPVKEVTDEERGKGQIKEIVGEGEAERLGVEKNLVWVMPGAPEETAVKKINELLVKKYGCDFVVEFHEYRATMNLINPSYTHYDMICDMREMGHQADIVYSADFNEYSALVEAGTYISFNEYFATDEGQKLYNAYALEFWKKTTRGGKIYGCFSDVYPSSIATALCNNDLVKKYDLVLPEGEWSFYDVGIILENANITKESIDSDEALLCCEPNALLLLEGYHMLANSSFKGILFKEIGDGWVVVNPAKEEAIIKLWGTIKEYADKGWYSDWYKTAGKALDGKFVFCFNMKQSEGITLFDNKYLCSDDTIREVIIGKQAYRANEPRENTINGVASWSQYKDEALKLITLIHTEAELSNLLQYGVEGVDYLYEDGMLYELPTKKLMSMPTSDTEKANINLLHSVLIDPEDKLAYSKEMAANFPDAPTMMYDIDISSYGEKMKVISEIYDSYFVLLFSGECEDVKATVVKMDEELSAAGINEVVEDINKQMKAQEANK